jgi:ribA/ribD-fused uncharacterized protein
MEQMRYSNELVWKKFKAGDRMKYLFFWGHQAAKDGSITAACFSQWWPAPFEAGGERYRTAEHWMMAEKARLSGDAEMRRRILQAGSPAEAKQLGREVRGFDPAVWNARKSEVVAEGNMHKFSAHPALKAFLIATGNRVLVEASPVDRVWGIGMAADHPQINNPLCWRGENLLGYALMEVRDRLAVAKS